MGVNSVNSSGSVPSNSQDINLSDDQTFEDMASDMGLQDPGASSSFTDGSASAASLSVADARLQLDELIKSTQAELKATQDPSLKEKLSQLKEIRTELNKYDSKGVVPAELSQRIADIQYVETADGAAGGFEEGNGSATQQIKELKAQIQQNANLDDTTRQALFSKIDKVEKSLSLNAVDEESAISQLDSVAQELSEYALYSPDVVRTSHATGLEPAQVDELFKKYGIDHLAIPPGEKEARLLGDPAFAERTDLEAQFADLKDKIGERKRVLDASNEEVRQYNAKMNGPDHDSSYQELLPKGVQTICEERLGRGELTKAVGTSAQTIASSVAALYSQMTGVECKPDPENADMILFGDKGSVSVIGGDGTTGEIGFGSKPFRLPPVELPKLEVDLEGDGQTQFTKLMGEAGYNAGLIHNIDEGGWLGDLALGVVGVAGAAWTGGVLLGAAGLVGIGNATDDDNESAKNVGA